MKAIMKIFLMLMVLFSQLDIQHAGATTSQPGNNNYLNELQVNRGTAIWFSKSAKVCKVIIEGNEVATLQAVFGVNPNGDKQKQGDYKTPLGVFYVVDKERLQDHPYLGKKWFGLSYPDVKHAETGLNTNLISYDEYRAIVRANATKAVPPQNTALGGYIGIHGGHENLTQDGINWTEGCIAMLDKDLEFLYKNVPVGTMVIVTA